MIEMGSTEDFVTRWRGTFGTFMIIISGTSRISQRMGANCKGGAPTYYFGQFSPKLQRGCVPGDLPMILLYSD